MYTLILIWSLSGYSEGGSNSLTVPNLTYKECTQQINNFQAGAINLNLKWSSCALQGEQK